MTTYSTSLKLTLIGDGEQSGTWGQTTNTNLGTLLEQAITGVQSISMLDANYTLSDLNGVSDEARNAVIVATGVITAQRDIIAPTVPKLYVIKNLTTGGYPVRIITSSSGSAVTVPNGAAVAVYCTGTDFFEQITGSGGNFTVKDNLIVQGTTSLTGNLSASTATFSGAISSVSPSFTGVPTVTTAVAGTNTTQAASTAFVATAIVNERSTSATLTNKTINGTNNSITNVSLTTGVTGTLPVGNGGTGQTTLASGALVLGAGTSGVTTLSGTGVGQIPQWDGSKWGVGSLPGGGVASVTASSPIASSGGSTPNISLNTSGVVAGIYNYPTITIDSYGRITAASSNTVGTVTSVSASAPIASTGGNTPTISLNTSGVTPGSYTNASISVDSYGRVTSASSGAGAGVTSFNAGSTGFTPSIATNGAITLAGTLNIANGGTGATTAANARTNLGVTATGQDTTYCYRANNLSDVNATSARTNLGLGSLATASSVNLSTQTTGAISLTSQVSGTLPVGNGGTGITASGASGNVLKSNGSAWTSAAISASISFGAEQASEISACSGNDTLTDLKAPAGFVLTGVGVIFSGGSCGRMANYFRIYFKTISVTIS